MSKITNITKIAKGLYKLLGKEEDSFYQRPQEEVQVFIDLGYKIEENKERVIDKLTEIWALKKNDLKSPIPNIPGPFELVSLDLVNRLGLVPYKDGDQWCILWGANIQEGICGFGKTPMEAIADFGCNLNR